jgi:gliding motility-associated-like protein
MKKYILFIILIVYFFTIEIVFSQCPISATPPLFFNPCDTNISITAGPCNGAQTFCMDDSVCLDINISGNIDSAFIGWENGIQTIIPGITSGSQLFYYKYPLNANSCFCPNGYCSVTITVGAWQNCNGVPIVVTVIMVPIILIPNPSAGFQLVTSDSLCYKTPVCFTLACNCNYSSNIFTWDFGDGNTSTLPNACHPYSDPITTTTNNITLTVSNSCGIATSTLPVTVFPSPQIVPTVSPTPNCYPDTFTLSSNGSNTGIYNWTVSGGTILGSNSNSTCTIIATAATVSVNLNASTYSGCDTTWSQTYNLQPGAFIDVITPVPDVCTAISFSFDFSLYYNVNPIAPGSIFSWNLSDGTGGIFSNNTSSPPPISLNPGNNTYIFSINISNSCNSISIIDTFITSLPVQVSVSPGDTIICKSNTLFDLTTYGIPAGGVWKQNGMVLNPPVFIPDSFTQACHSFIYSNNSNMCPTYDTLDICVEGWNIFAGNDITVCGNADTIHLVGSPFNGVWTSPATSICFLPPDMFVPSINCTSTQFVYTISNLIYPGITCVIPDTINVSVAAPPSGTYSLPDSGCINTTVDLNIILSTGLNGTWYIGNGWSNSILNPGTYIFSNSGIDSLKLVVTDIGSCTDTLYGIIEIGEPPIPQFSSIPNIGCDSLEVIFTNLTSDTSGISFYWEFGNGNTSNNFIPGSEFFHTNSANEITTVNNILHASNVCGEYLFTDSVTILPRPNSELGLNIGDTCSPATLEFANYSTGGPNTYQWLQNANNTLHSLGNDSMLSPQILFAGSNDTTYLFLLVSSNLCGNDTSTNQVVIHPNQVSAFMSTNYTFGCAPLTIDFNDYSAPFNSLLTWDFGDNTNGIGTSITHTYNIPGTYVIIHSVDGECGFDVDTQVVEVFQQPDAGFEIKPKNCQNELVFFRDTTKFSSGSEWFFGDGNSSLTNPVYHQYATDNFYTVQLITHSNGNDCTDTLEKIIEIVPAPIASFNIPENFGCAPFQIVLKSDSICICNYFWDMGNTHSVIGSENFYIYEQPGEYSITHTIIDNNNCKDDSTFNFINVHPVPISLFECDKFETSIHEPYFSFTNYSIDTTGFLNTLWDFDDQSYSFDFHTFHSFKDTGHYQVTLIETNIYGCRDTSWREVIVKPDFIFYVPNSFTPNADDVNDIFIIEGQYIKTASIEIFNRWGELIFRSNPLIKAFWDGTSQLTNKKVQQDTYVYKIQVENSEGHSFQRIGHVTVIH